MRRAIVALAVMTLVGCAKRAPPDGGDACACEDAAAAVDADLMAFLSAARALHHEANVREDEHDVRGAVAAIERLVALPRPRAAAPPPEVREVLADAHARLAELRVRAGDLEAARRAVDEGLRFAPEGTYFRGHLLEMSGLVEETRATALADAGQPAAAASARARAIDDLDEAVRVQRGVIQRAGGARGP